ncbi:beta-ketoacyl-ACP synthase III [Hirschia baltica]|uniref:3-Oxoacyl-(Acyl-carrier-protein (ACP)) synthase III domain protein n=1 Tax=Hirschia baltica (strain ATCC 49814 / DSM 5838 / IFAM 1418) TaxID=582402 RepID=C6XR42_HIRBI|nr:beta-ketoacyl-ACP synthase III [Hirschia baltica]ACT60573.1 3-Oxoacyl-(acyl-carrier-protein (ACP)) synthase III domain protein [Hirschia baltica ATCC 49814]
MTRSVYVTRSAAFMPGEAVSNDEMEAILGQAGGRPSRARRMILRSNKIVSRHYAIDPETGKPTYSNAQLAAEAVRGLDEPSKLNEVQVLACGTSMPDQIFPNHGVMVQGELKLPPIEVSATAGVCLAGVTSLKYAYMSVASGESDTSVATGSENASTILAAHNFEAELDAKVEALEENPEIAFEKDFIRWMLSDGAGALMLESAPRDGAVNLKVEWIDVYSYAGEMETCMYAGAVKNEDGTTRGWTSMTAKERDADSVMSVKQDVKLLNENIMMYAAQKPVPIVAEKHKITPDDVDWFVPHYSSDYFRVRLFDALKAGGFEIPMEKWFTNLSTKGNTGSASIYIMLDELLKSGKLKSGEKIMCWVPESGRFSTAFMLFTVV